MFGKLFSSFINFFKKKKPEPESQPQPAAEARISAELELSSGLDDDWLIITEADIQEITDEERRRNHAIESEFLARNVAYRLAVPASQKRDIADAQKYRLLEKKYHFESLGSKNLEDAGVFIYGLVHENPNAPIHIVCRGTQGDASIIRDLDPTGPAYKTFQNYSSDILAQLQELSAKYPGRKINLCGHSLGGALAQMIGAAILKAKADANSSLFESLKGLEFTIFQSAWVPDELIDEATASVKTIHETHPDFSVALTSHVKQGDFVSRTGGTLFADVLPDVAEVNLDMRPLDKPILSVEDGLIIAAGAVISPNPVSIGVNVASRAAIRFVQNRIDAHTDRFFHESEFFDGEQPENLKQIGQYGILSNKNPEDRARITHVFNKNDRKHIPGHDTVAEKIYDAAQNIPSEEVVAGIACVAAVAVVAPVAATVCFTAATGTTAQLTGRVAGAIPKVSNAVGTVLSHAPRASSLIRRVVRASH